MYAKPELQVASLALALQRLTPHAWFMQGLAELGSDASWTAALPAAAAMMVFALVTGGLSYVLLQRRLTR
jgi:hypothetical protein